MSANGLTRPDETEASTSATPPSPILYSELQNSLVEPTKPIHECLYPPLQKSLTNDTNPTAETYTNLGVAFDFFNSGLFYGQLPRPLITLQCSGQTRAIYRHQRFGAAFGEDRVDEIGMNSRFFLFRSPEEILSDLVHEMCHVKQFHFGKHSRNGYHNKQFAEFMDDVDLIASDTGAEGGKNTGQRMSHYIVKEGAFARACRELIEVHGFVLAWGDVKGEPIKGVVEALKSPKAKSTTTYLCPNCSETIEGRPLIRVTCEDCNTRFIDTEAVSASGDPPEGEENFC